MITQDGSRKSYIKARSSSKPIDSSHASEPEVKEDESMTTTDNSTANSACDSDSIQGGALASRLSKLRGAESRELETQPRSATPRKPPPKPSSSPLQDISTTFDTAMSPMSDMVGSFSFFQSSPTNSDTPSKLSHNTEADMPPRNTMQSPNQQTANSFSAFFQATSPTPSNSHPNSFSFFPTSPLNATGGKESPTVDSFLGKNFGISI
jgi:hypothetical protein